MEAADGCAAHGRAPTPPGTGIAPTAGLLLLADARSPSGTHVHSGGLEAAASRGWLRDEDDLRSYLAGRLVTAGLTAATFAAAACAVAGNVAMDSDGRTLSGWMWHCSAYSGAMPHPSRKIAPIPAAWHVLDAELDARTPSPSQRQASRAQGRGLLRAARRAWPHPLFDGLRAATPPAPHHPLVLGGCAHVAGGTPGQAAGLAAYGAVAGSASAAVRLLGLDPLGVHAVLASLARRVDAVAAAGAEAALAADGDWAELPAPSAPGLDLLAELHQRSEVRLFES